MQAIILAGGKGTRIRDLFPETPKALIPVAGTPMLQRQLEWLATAGVNPVCLVLGYQADAITKWCETQRIPGLRMTWVTEPSPLGTAGAVKFAEPEIQSDPFLVLNGDSLLPALDFVAFVRDHEENDAGATLAVTRIEKTGRYGTVEFDDSGRLTAFREKAERASGWVNGGVYAMNRAVLNVIQPEKALSLETDVFPLLSQQGTLRVFPAPPPLLDMGTADGLDKINRYFASGSPS